MILALAAIGVVLAVLAATLLPRLQRAQRESFVRTYMFPPGLLAALGKRRPGLGLKEQQLAARALRQFFLCYLKGGRRQVAMPSQVVDDLWHEFILHTRTYDSFCRRAFGRFLHHTPAAALGPARATNEGLRRVWWHACLEENINPRRPTRLPLLFALDRKLGVADGFAYAVDCNNVRRTAGRDTTTVVHCGSDFGSTSFDGSTDGFGDSGGGGDHGGGGSSGGAGATGEAGGSDSGSGDGGGGCSGGCGGS